jgi:hypothetical protein
MSQTGLGKNVAGEQDRRYRLQLEGRELTSNIRGLHTGVKNAREGRLVSGALAAMSAFASVAFFGLENYFRNVAHDPEELIMPYGKPLAVLTGAIILYSALNEVRIYAMGRKAEKKERRLAEIVRETRDTGYTP